MRGGLVAGEFVEVSGARVWVEGRRRQICDEVVMKLSARSRCTYNLSVELFRRRDGEVARGAHSAGCI